MAAKQALAPPAGAVEVLERPIPPVGVDEVVESASHSDPRTDLQEWRDYLPSLWHYDRNYPYNPDYDYASTWTDDPQYVVEGVRRFMDPQHLASLRSFMFTLLDDWNDLVQIDRKIEIPQDIRDGLSANNEYRNKQKGVIPDAIIAARSLPLEKRKLTVRPHDPDHPDQLYLEVVSKTREAVKRDTEHKMEVYQALGIREYLLYDPFMRLGEKPHLYMYRLAGDGIPAYVAVAPERWEHGHPVYRSEVLDRDIRMLPAKDRGLPIKQPDTEHRLQLWDPVRKTWWDPDVEIELNLAATRVASRAEGHAEGRAEGRAEGQFEARIEDRLELLEGLPVAEGESVTEVLNTLEQSWRRAGKVPSIADTALVVAGRQSWRSLLVR